MVKYISSSALIDNGLSEPSLGWNRRANTREDKRVEQELQRMRGECDESVAEHGVQPASRSSCELQSHRLNALHASKQIAWRTSSLTMKGSELCTWSLLDTNKLSCPVSHECTELKNKYHCVISPGSRCAWHLIWSQSRKGGTWFLTLAQKTITRAFLRCVFTLLFVGLGDDLVMIFKRRT